MENKKNANKQKKTHRFRNIKTVKATLISNKTS